MFNFLDYKLLPKLIGNPLSTENYEAENLISKEYSKKQRGFIAYPSIKPPVELEFELICNVNISYIFINTTVGNHRCSGVEIFSKNNNSEYTSIGRAVYDAQGIIFCNSRRYSNAMPPPSYSKNVALNFFKNGSFKSFLNATNLKLVIFRTEKSVPCLASIEIWGLPSKTCSQKTVETIHRLYGQNNDNIKRESKEETNENEFKIPHEFRDDLTYELMTIPYTLPSGKTIDQTTLEKHTENEKSFGRKPGDPFTGIKFTETLKPILNVGLKSRIDMFLLQNSHRSETFHLKRSLRADNNVRKKMKQNNLATNTNNSDSSKDESNSLINKARNETNFISFTQSSDFIANICILCKITCEYLYELPCGHYYCRKCLLDICKNCSCIECKVHFVRGDVKKVDLM